MTKLNPDYTIPFGVHKGKTINEIPSSYLEWLSLQDWVEKKFPDLLTAGEAELEWRDKFGKHFE
jgi:uncharacterized protein (DUF3820 family)